MPVQNLHKCGVLHLHNLNIMETILFEKDGTAVLQGKICPFRAPLVLPSATIAGQLTIQNIPCTNACPLLEYDSFNNLAVIHCGCKSLQFNVNFIFRKDLEDQEKLVGKKSQIIT
jgi:hypothetical protein